ncbi:MAG: ion transporter [Bacteroidota bacterium]
MTQEDATPAGRLFDLIVQTLIVISLITFSVETIPDLSEEVRYWLRITEAIIVFLFTAEYALRLFAAEDRLRFVFSFYGLVDLLAILPFYIARGVDLRSLRAFRLLRLARALKFLRHSRAIHRFRLAFNEIRSEIALFLMTCGILVYISSVGIYYFESRVQPDAFGSVFSSMWWAVATLTTVGYGDVYPVTAGGRLFTTLILFIGLGVIAVPSGLIASSLSEVLRDEHEEEERQQP